MKCRLNPITEVTPLTPGFPPSSTRRSARDFNLKIQNESRATRSYLRCTVDSDRIPDGCHTTLVPSDRLGTSLSFLGFKVTRDSRRRGSFRQSGAGSDVERRNSDSTSNSFPTTLRPNPSNSWKFTLLPNPPLRGFQSRRTPITRTTSTRSVTMTFRLTPTQERTGTDTFPGEKFTKPEVVVRNV